MIRFLNFPTVSFLALAFVLAAPQCMAQTNEAAKSAANRLAYLDESDPFYVGLNFPKLTTPQWVGEPGVDAVIILAVDDMKETPKYETFLRPILDRLKQIDGRAPVSIMCTAIDSRNDKLQSWLKEGLSVTPDVKALQRRMAEIDGAEDKRNTTPQRPEKLSTPQSSVEKNAAQPAGPQSPAEH
jgi:hypothetical protein